MTTLRQRLIEDLQVRNRSPHTIRSYVACIAHFARHFGKSPELLGPEEIRQYQVYLVNERRVSFSYLIQIVPALRFLYCITLQRDWAIRHIAYPKQPKRLPVVLSQAEVRRLFDAIRSPRHLAILMTAYAAGLRLSEVTQLLITDIDSSRMVIRVRQGKGHKDRYVMLAPTLLEVLRLHWRRERPATWLFPGQHPDQPICNHVVQEVCRKAGIAKSLGYSRRWVYRWVAGALLHARRESGMVRGAHEQLKQKSVTRQLLWDEYCQQHAGKAYQYTKFCMLYGQPRGVILIRAIETLYEWWTAPLSLDYTDSNGSSNSSLHSECSTFATPLRVSAQSPVGSRRYEGQQHI
jgi:integrase/recombinase XerD